MMKKLIAAAFVCLLATTSIARADTAADLKAQMEALQKQMEANQKQILEMQAQLEKLQAQKPEPQPGPRRPAPQPVVTEPGNNTVFLIHGEPVQVYGTLDLDYESTTKGLAQYYPTSGDSPQGNVGWEPGISSQSFIGVRGARPLGQRFMPVYQLETQVDVSTTSGFANTNSNNSATVKGALTSRNSFIGIANKYGGSLMIGKTDAPYKVSTQRLDYTSSTLGDNAVIMGNSGGDNRVEFATRLDHAIWWNSPNWGGLTFGLLASPGQNRNQDDLIQASGESDCAGGNVPGSGAGSPFCNDGSFGTAYSGSVAYSRKRLYLTAAYEMHKRVNRSGDAQGLPAYASNYPLDIGDEDASKVGAEWNFGRVRVAGIYEQLRRFMPQVFMPQNERTRNGWWLTPQATLPANNTLSIGWARANPTPGDPGQHNTPTTTPFGTPNPDNMANMFTGLLVHRIDQHFSVYVNYAATINHALAHFDLGAGGRGLTTDCHDGTPIAAFDPTITDANGNPIGGVTGTGPHCYAGGSLHGIATGIRLQF